jgi:hypothetical protein
MVHKKFFPGGGELYGAGGIIWGGGLGLRGSGKKEIDKGGGASEPS